MTYDDCRQAMDYEMDDYAAGEPILPLPVWMSLDPFWFQMVDGLL